MAFNPLMNATNSRSDVIGWVGGGGVKPSRWNDSRRRAVSSMWATTSRTRQAPATVGRCQSSRVNRRSTPTSCVDTGRNISRVSTRGNGASGIRDLTLSRHESRFDLVDSSLRMR
jgi:hypothetical protein